MNAFIILGIAYFIIMLWCFWEAYNAPLMSDEYNENVKSQKE